MSNTTMVKEELGSAHQAGQHIILFYKYHPLSDDKEKTEVYRHALETLCSNLSLKGRILVGYSETEGINGTLAGEYLDVAAFTSALLGEKKWEPTNNNEDVGEKRLTIIRHFWKKARDFFESIQQPMLEMNSPEDFKWSHCSEKINDDDKNAPPLFPDLNIKLVKELIGTGGVMSSISLEETATGYLTPMEWHEEIRKLSDNNSEDNKNGENKNDTILIDCRNTKEWEIGHFEGAIDPVTTTFAQFPKWVENHRHMLEDKRVLMYCTGGIRCEKASAYVRRQVPSVKKVQHLKGGIHKYLEAVGEDNSESVWKGKNFIFHTPVETTLGPTTTTTANTTTTARETAGKQSSNHTSNSNNTIVGKCIYCKAPYDQFDPQCVCTVCREPTLTCLDCQQNVTEFHCKQHFHLRDCYFSNLVPFSKEDLQQQLNELETILVEIAVGKRYKQKRKTLHKQCDKIRQRLNELEDGNGIKATDSDTQQRCRNCDDIQCSGRCWGFYSLKRKEALEQKRLAKEAAKVPAADGVVPVHDSESDHDKKKRNTNERHRDRFSKEASDLNLSLPPSCHRDPQTGIRVPPPCTRILQTKMKGKWKGKSVLQVVKEEFVELAKPGVLERVLESGLLRVNDVPITTENAGTCLMTGDNISRIVHWHEPPVIVPERISVQKVGLPEAVKVEFGIPENANDTDIYVCSKPSSLPVHPAGPYLSNSLTLMVEAQEKLAPQSLSPCHRTDRVTSGLTICCTNAAVARVIQRSMCEKQVKKLYLARVHGCFPGAEQEVSSLSVTDAHTIADVKYCSEMNCIRVDAPIETVDPANGIRQVSEAGKEACSLFQLLSYDATSNVSLVCCQPITGRSHQLRVHLKLLGFPIVGDVLYGGSDINEASAVQRKAAAIDALLLSTNQKEPELKLGSISDNDAAAARKSCGLCQPIKENGDHSVGNANTFFTSAQLLEKGHSIDLHASRYRVDILPSKKRNDGSSTSEKPLEALDFHVESPPWAHLIQTKNLTWLDDGGIMK